MDMNSAPSENRCIDHTVDQVVESPEGLGRDPAEMGQRTRLGRSGAPSLFYRYQYVLPLICFETNDPLPLIPSSASAARSWSRISAYSVCTDSGSRA